jgi:hypothetical protein
MTLGVDIDFRNIEKEMIDIVIRNKEIEIINKFEIQT